MSRPGRAGSPGAARAAAWMPQATFAALVAAARARRDQGAVEREARRAAGFSDGRSRAACGAGAPDAEPTSSAVRRRLDRGLAAGAWHRGAAFPGRHRCFRASKSRLNGQDFRPVIGAGVEDGTALGVGAIATDGNALADHVAGPPARRGLSDPALSLRGLSAHARTCRSCSAAPMRRTTCRRSPCRGPATASSRSTCALRPRPGAARSSNWVSPNTRRRNWCRRASRFSRSGSISARLQSPAWTQLAGAVASALVRLSAVEPGVDQRARQDLPTASTSMPMTLALGVGAVFRCSRRRGFCAIGRGDACCRRR